MGRQRPADQTKQAEDGSVFEQHHERNLFHKLCFFCMRMHTQTINGAKTDGRELLVCLPFVCLCEGAVAGKRPT